MTFVMKYENCTFPEAIKILADKAGVELPQMEYSEEARRREARRARLLEVNKEAAKFYYYQLRTPHGEKAREYLDGRRLTEETRRNFGLGYAPVRGGELITYLRQKGYSDDLIRDVGLAKTDEKRGTTTQFWNRVMFPIQDINHRVIGFGGRIMSAENNGPKYLNSPETEFLIKAESVWHELCQKRQNREYHSVRGVYGCDQYAPGRLYTGSSIAWYGFYAGTGCPDQEIYQRCVVGV